MKRIVFVLAALMISSLFLLQGCESEQSKLETERTKLEIEKLKREAEQQKEADKAKDHMFSTDKIKDYKSHADPF